MSDLGFRKPENVVSQGGSLGVEFAQIGANATAALCIPGIVVMRDGNDYAVKEWAAGTGGDVGFLGYERSPDKPDTIDTAYSRGDTVAIHKGGGRRQRAILINGASVTKGQPLKVSTGGRLALAVINGVVNVDETGTDETVSTGNDDVIAEADETVDASTGEAPIWVIPRR